MCVRDVDNKDFKKNGHNHHWESIEQVMLFDMTIIMYILGKHIDTQLKNVKFLVLFAKV